jgi:hypothetical protein
MSEGESVACRSPDVQPHLEHRLIQVGRRSQSQRANMLKQQERLLQAHGGIDHESPDSERRG